MSLFDCYYRPVYVVEQATRATSFCAPMWKIYTFAKVEKTGVSAPALLGLTAYIQSPQGGGSEPRLGKFSDWE